MIDVLKKNWFVVLIAIIFIGFSIFCVYDTNKGKLPTKQVGGQDVVASLGNDINITADDLYNKMYEGGGQNLVLLKTQAAIFDEAIKTDDAIKADAENIKAYLESEASNYASQYGMDQVEALQEVLGQYGYTVNELDYFCLIQAKLGKMQEDYINANLETLFKPLVEENQGRIVSHILVKFADVNNPTAEETKIYEEIKAKLGDNPSLETFEAVAKEYAQYGDTGSAQEGGYLGYMDKNTSYVDSFKQAALKTEAGNYTGWVKESNTSYSGYHFIYVHETDASKMLANEKFKEAAISEVQANGDVSTKYMEDAIKNLEITFADEEMEKLFNETVLGQTSEE